MRTAERLLQTTTAVLPEIAGSHELLLAESMAALAGMRLRGTRRSYTCLPQCYFCGVHATYLDANFVVMLCFKFVYAVFYGIYRWLFLASR